jgi:hypothetical protein
MIHWIDLKFKGFRFMFIFNLNGVFTTDFLKMAPIRVRFIARDFLQEEDFTGRKLCQRGSLEL